MPGGLHFADDILRRVTLGQTTEEKVEGILTFLYELTDQLRYMFDNIELDQFTSEALKEQIMKILEEQAE